jgi:two-component system sensor histidine kinase BaeS
MIKRLRRHLGWKIFFSYLVVIVVGVVVLATATEFVVPSAFDRHLAAMGSMMTGMMGTDMMGTDLNNDLFSNFRAAVNEALAVAALAATLAAIAVSVFVSRQVVIPVQEMMLASRRIAEGHYSERVQIAANVKSSEMDELDQLALSFNRMASALEQVESKRRQLIGDVAHELRTPLTTIKGSMEGLIDGMLPSNEDAFQEIYREADRMERLVNDLQELSRVEVGAYDLELRPLAVSHLVDVTVQRLSRQFEEKGIVLDLNIPKGLPNVYADENRIYQVLLNLVGNALQYTPQGGRVEITADYAEGEVFITVTDTGIGIPKEHLENIFTRFYRVDKSRSRAGGGSGIGLTISKHLVEAHGGRIWVEDNQSRKGSVFTFTLPIAN